MILIFCGTNIINRPGEKYENYQENQLFPIANLFLIPFSPLSKYLTSFQKKAMDDPAVIDI
ncbi:hypothetical protein DHB64_14750 [Antarcticibacterium sp. W02-3]|nr:hypothetical protein [Antarcticibacterium sp. W02-3]